MSQNTIEKLSGAGDADDFEAVDRGLQAIEDFLALGAISASMRAEPTSIPVVPNRADRPGLMGRPIVVPHLGWTAVGGIHPSYMSPN